MGEVWDDIYPDHFFYPMNICWNNLRSDVTRWNCYQYQHSLLLSLWLSLWIYLSFLNLPIHLKEDKNIPWKAVNTSIQLIYGFPKFQKVKNLPCKPRCKIRRQIYLARRSTLPLRFRRIKNLPCKACSKSSRRKKPCKTVDTPALFEDLANASNLPRVQCCYDVNNFANQQAAWRCDNCQDAAGDGNLKVESAMWIILAMWFLSRWSGDGGIFINTQLWIIFDNWEANCCLIF